MQYETIHKKQGKSLHLGTESSKLENILAGED